jgi:heme exporter protein B
MNGAPPVGLLTSFGAVLRRDLQLGFRRWTDAGQAALFFVLVAALFPLALNPKAEFLRGIAAGVLWIAALLASLLATQLQYRADLEDGSLEQLLHQPAPLGWLLLAKISAHWIVTGVPLVLLAPVMAITYHLPTDALPTLVLSLLLGTPTLCLLGSVGAALTAGLSGAGVLLAFIVAPLMVPVLILGARATDLAMAGEDASGPLFLLGALLSLGAALAPWASALAVRVSVE